MKAATKRAVWYYNFFRPHTSLNYLTPNQASKMEGQFKKRWKNYAAIKRKKLQFTENTGYIGETVPPLAEQTVPLVSE